MYRLNDRASRLTGTVPPGINDYAYRTSGPPASIAVPVSVSRTLSVPVAKIEGPTLRKVSGSSGRFCQRGERKSGLASRSQRYIRLFHL